MADDDDFDTDGPGDIDDDGDGSEVASAAGELSVISGGARVLKLVAALAALLWAAAIVSVFWNVWDLTRNDAGGGLTTGSIQNTRLAQVLSTTLTSTWGYALVAVLAYTGAMMLHGQRMRLLVAAMAADD
jgi:hypothetical protein